LCISAKYPEIYAKATRQAEDLILGLFCDFHNYLKGVYNDKYFIPAVIKKEGNSSSPLMKFIYPMVGSWGQGRLPEIRDRSGKIIPIYSGINDQNNNVVLLKEATHNQSVMRHGNKYY
jgi:hypothetical protein